MIHLSSYLHRDQFRHIVARWFVDELEESDALDVKYIVNYNSVLVKRTVRALAHRIFKDVYGIEARSQIIRTKGALKDYITDHPTVTNERIERLIHDYREEPENYFKETPTEARIFCTHDIEHPLFLGTARMKRLRRISEKGGRRVSDFVFQRIQEDARRSALERAQAAHTSIESLVSTPEVMLREFNESEARIRAGIKRKQLPILDQRFDINDVGGMKLVAEKDVQQEIMRYIEHAPDMALLEVEEHSGNYNATNLTVELFLNKDALLADPIDPEDVAILKMRGFDPAAISHDLKAFVDTAEDSIVVEIILSNFSEFLESEIGRCQHEIRLRAQRQSETYRGSLAKNSQYLLTYLFAFAVSPQTQIDELPIKLLGNYVPDYVDQIIRKLYGVYDFTLAF